MNIPLISPSSLKFEDIASKALAVYWQQLLTYSVNDMTACYELLEVNEGNN